MTCSGGGITVCQGTGASTLVANLPWVASWVVKIQRPSAERTSLAGTVIREAADKDASAGTATYSGLVPEADAETLADIDAAGAACFVSDGKNVYEAEIDATVYHQIRAGKRQVEAAFKIVRKVL